MPIPWDIVAGLLAQFGVLIAILWTLDATYGRDND